MSSAAHHLVVIPLKMLTFAWVYQRQLHKVGLVRHVGASVVAVAVAAGHSFVNSHSMGSHLYAAVEFGSLHSQSYLARELEEEYLRSFGCSVGFHADGDEHDPYTCEAIQRNRDLTVDHRNQVLLMCT